MTPVARRRQPAASAAAPAALPPGIRLTSADRVVYPDEGITKGDVAAYYAFVADRLLTHAADRPLSMVRCPAGQAGSCFFQKHPPVGMSSAVSRIRVREKSGTDTYLTIHNVEGLLALVQFGALEIHLWGAKAEQIERPDRLVFDLDPGPSVGWKRVVAAALLLRDLLTELKLKSFVKTTGGKGLHVVVPIAPGPSWPEVKAFCRGIAETVSTARPREFLSTMSKADRKGRIFIDYLRNERGATSVAAYSTRAKPGAPISMPISWAELPTLKSAATFRLQNVERYLKSRGRDPWQTMERLSQRLSPKLLQTSSRK